MRIRTIFLWTLVLIMIDQTIKIIINVHFLESHFDIIPSILEFKPVFNQKHSYVNVLLSNNFNINIGLLPHLILFLLAAIAVTIVYDFYRSFINSKLLDFAFILFISGWSCALAGNLIWTKGVLDYIYLKPLFIFDLKDLYINCFAILLFLSLVKNKAKVEGIKKTDFISHIKKRLRII